MDYEEPEELPDQYVGNPGVEVYREAIYHQYGQVRVRIMHNTFQSTLMQMSLEQAKDLAGKLAETIREIEEGQ
jgi:hypothetical protein